MTIDTVFSLLASLDVEYTANEIRDIASRGDIKPPRKSREIICRKKIKKKNALEKKNFFPSIFWAENIPGGRIADHAIKVHFIPFKITDESKGRLTRVGSFQKLEKNYF